MAAFILVGALGLHLANPSESGNPVSESTLHKVFSLAMVQELQKQQENALPAGANQLSQVTIEQAPRGAEPAPVKVEENREQAAERNEEAAVQEEPSRCADAAQSSVFCVYTVQPGDTLSHIASHFDLAPSPAFSPSQLIAFSNGMTVEQSLLIQPGQELRVPLESGILHVVSSSEALSTVAQKYGVSSQSVVTKNEIANPDTIRPGTVLLIPAPVNAPLSSQPDLPLLAVRDDEDEPDSETSTPAASETLSAARAQVEDDEPELELAVTLEAEVEETPAPTTEPSPQPAETVQQTPVQASAAATTAPTPTPNVSPSPTSAGRTASTSSPAATREQIAADFAAGYRSAGGSESTLRHILDKVIPCESGYNLKAYNPAGPFHGLMQFLPETWKLAGGGDWHDAWQQGANTARLLNGRDPRSQWPSCW